MTPGGISDGGEAVGDASTGEPGRPDAMVPSMPPPTPTPPPYQQHATPDAAPPPPKPKPDAAPPPPPPPPDAAPPQTKWTDAQKCENMCQSYCIHRYNCDGTSISKCRMMIDDADGGTCQERAYTFHDITQSQVQACIDAIDAMSCTDFERMYNTGVGVPSACKGILK